MKALNDLETERAFAERLFKFAPVAGFSLVASVQVESPNQPASRSHTSPPPEILPEYTARGACAFVVKTLHTVHH